MKRLFLSLYFFALRVKSAPRRWLAGVIESELTAHQERSWAQFQQFYNDKAAAVTPGVSTWMSGLIREELYKLIEDFSHQNPNLAPSFLGKRHLLNRPLTSRNIISQE